MKNYTEAKKLFTKYVNVETMLKHASNNDVKNILNKMVNRSGLTPEVPVKSFCDGLIIDRLTEIAKNLPDEGYSMGSNVRVRFNVLTGRDNRTCEYSHSSNYTAKHGFIGVSFGSEFKNIKVIGGIVTHVYPNQRNKVKKCWWYVGEGSKSRFELKKDDGFVFGGYHGTDKKDVKKRGQRNLDSIKASKKWQKQENKLIELRAKKYRKALRLQYSFDDSIDCGNCLPGTKAFIIRLHLDSKKLYRGKFLLDSANAKSSSSVSYVERMINFKASKL
jgi:hypothetical protein